MKIRILPKHSRERRVEVYLSESAKTLLVTILSGEYEPLSAVLIKDGLVSVYGEAAVEQILEQLELQQSQIEGVL